MSAMMVLSVVELILLGVQLTAEATTAFGALRDSLKALEGRDPTPGEWAAIDGETKRLLGNLSRRAEEARRG